MNWCPDAYPVGYHARMGSGSPVAASPNDSGWFGGRLRGRSAGRVRPWNRTCRSRPPRTTTTSAVVSGLMTSNEYAPGCSVTPGSAIARLIVTSVRLAGESAWLDTANPIAASPTLTRVSSARRLEWDVWVTVMTYLLGYVAA